MSERKKCRVLGVEFERHGSGWQIKEGTERLRLWDADGAKWFAELTLDDVGTLISAPNRRTKPAAYRALLALLSDELKDRWPEVLRPPGEKAKRGGK